MRIMAYTVPYCANGPIRYHTVFSMCYALLSVKVGISDGHNKSFCTKVILTFTLVMQ